MAACLIGLCTVFTSPNCNVNPLPPAKRPSFVRPGNPSFQLDSPSQSSHANVLFPTVTTDISLSRISFVVSVGQSGGDADAGLYFLLSQSGHWSDCALEQDQLCAMPSAQGRSLTSKMKVWKGSSSKKTKSRSGLFTPYSTYSLDSLEIGQRSALYPCMLIL